MPTQTAHDTYYVIGHSHYSIQWYSIVALLLAFLSGSFPTALLMGKIKGVDLRKVGSGNIGATNALRSLGVGWGVSCLIIDAFKGWAPAYLLRAAPWHPGTISEPVWMLAVGFCAIAGHTFSPWVNWRGGKGVATSLGVFAAVAPLPILICFIIGAVLIATTSYVSLASITGATLLPFLIFFLTPPDGRSWPVIGLAALVGAFVIWKHRPNIQRLLNGTENKITWRKPR